MNINLPQPSWEVFGECEECFAGPGMPCYAVRSTSKQLKPLSNPHKTRKQLKTKSVYDNPRNEISDRFSPR